MKKKILGGLLVLAIAAVAAFNVNMNTEKNELSLLALANVEALAQYELPEIGITCHQYARPGRMNQCWRPSPTWTECVPTGIPYQYCWWG